MTDEPEVKGFTDPLRTAEDAVMRKIQPFLDDKEIRTRTRNVIPLIDNFQSAVAQEITRVAPLGKMDLADRTTEAAADSNRWFPGKVQNILHHTVALCGEVGECANLVKKQDRGSITMRELQEQLGPELVDVLVYIFNCAAVMDIDLEDEYNKKRVFNEKRFSPNLAADLATAKRLIEEEVPDRITIVSPETYAKLEAMDALNPPPVEKFPSHPHKLMEGDPNDATDA